MVLTLLRCGHRVVQGVNFPYLKFPLAQRRRQRPNYTVGSKWACSYSRKSTRWTRCDNNIQNVGFTEIWKAFSVWSFKFKLTSWWLVTLRRSRSRDLREVATVASRTLSIAIDTLLVSLLSSGQAISLINLRKCVCPCEIWGYSMNRGKCFSPSLFWILQGVRSFFRE